MNTLIRACMGICLTAVALWLVPKLFLHTVEAGHVGVRQSNVSGVYEEDLAPGWHWRIPGIHKIRELPTSYTFLDYTEDESARLQIRTKDNNIVSIDVTVPIRIKAGHANELVKAGNHVRDAGGEYRYQRLARETTVSVLREELAGLDSGGFYSTDKRLEVSAQTLELLNEGLAELHVEAQSVLIRAVAFRDQYEQQLQQIQLNEQNKLLDKARQDVAEKQQGLDAYLQGTQALAAAREQDWVKRRAELERAYEVGFVDRKGDSTPGAARRALAALTAEERAKLFEQAVPVFGVDSAEELSEAYLLGIKNIEAETLEYKKRVTTEAEAIAKRLQAEGNAMVDKVQGEYETKVNALLNSPAGRAYVAWKSAANVKFDKSLTFRSSDGIPSVLRLRDFAQQFMGR